MQAYVDLIRSGVFPDEYQELKSDASVEFMVDWMTTNPALAVEMLINTNDDSLIDAMEFELRKQLEAAYDECAEESQQGNG